MHLPRSALFPYTTLFRSLAEAAEFGDVQEGPELAEVHAPYNQGIAERETCFFAMAALSAISGPAGGPSVPAVATQARGQDRKSTRLNSSHVKISYAVFCL